MFSITPRRFERIEAVLARRQPDLTVFMEQVHKAHNLGAIVRTCDAVGVGEVHAVWPEGEEAVARRAALGSQRWVRERRHDTLADGVRHLHERGITVLAAHASEGALDYREADYTRPTAILVGTELDGVSDEAAALADACIAIPMVGMVGSLNVSVAAALVLYEAHRQREAAGLYERRRLPDEEYERLRFEWAFPGAAERCRRRGLPYPPLGDDGAIVAPDGWWDAMRRA